MNQKILTTKFPEHLKGLPKIPYCTYREYRPTFYAADRLLVICSRKTDCQPEPAHWNWTSEDVARWVAEELNHPELQEAFLKNEIDGKDLIFLEADKFPRINIKKFELIKELTGEIRKLCKLDQDEFRRSISLPFRRPKTLYLWYKARRTGPTAYFMTPSKYFRKIKIIRDETSEIHEYYALLNHWNRIPPYQPWCPHVMIGNIRRVNPMTGTTQRQNFHPKKPPYLLKNLCIYHVPCDSSSTNLIGNKSF